MKTPILRFTLSAIIAYLTCGTLNPAIAASQPNWTHYCGVIDDQLNKQHSDQFPNRRYARTSAANLKVGEPRTVRMIYFLPNDRPYRADVVQRMKDEILRVQTFYAEQMGVHGYGKVTFRVETDFQGEPIVHRVNGQHSDRYYLNNTAETVEKEIRQAFSIFSNIYFIVIDNSIDAIGRGDRYTVGVGGRGKKNGGYALVPSGFEWDVAAHELGHAFGLWHDFNDDIHIMSYGTARNRLSLCSAEFLSVHTYFNSDIPIEEGQSPIIELTSPRTYPPGSESVPVQLKVSDSEGLHQVFLFTSVKFTTGTGFYEVKACQTLANKREEIVEFLYDGVIPSVPGSSLSRPSAHLIHVEAIDTDGNVSEIDEVITASVLEVDIPDKALRAIIEKALGKPLGARITTSDMEALTRLVARRGDIRGLTGLEFASYLTSLTLDEQQISDITPLANLTGLEWLDVSGSEISNISPLANLTHLEGLNLWGNQISNISPLAALNRLETLYLGGNQVSNISALANLTQLEKLILSDSQISDITPLGNLTRLEDLDLRDNQISDITPLGNLTRLEDLDLRDNQISDITPLATLTRLRVLELHANQVSDITPLANLTRLEWLDLWGNQVSDINPLANLTQLEGLNLWANQISDISPLVTLTRLETLYLGRNQVSDISALANLTRLEKLDLWDNSISDLSPLVTNTGLGSGDTVDVSENPLSSVSIDTHIPTLQSRGIEVEFDNLKPMTLEYLWSMPAGISLIHVPLKVTAVDGVARTIASIAALYNALGGASKVSFLITYDSQAQEWRSYFGPSDTGTPADRALTDDTGIIAGMITPTSIRLRGGPLGTDGSSSITLNQGLNLVGLPLKDSRVNRVSDLFALDGIGGNVSVIILTDNGGFKAVGQADDPGDIAITGGQAFIMTAQRTETVTISGDGWYNSLGIAAAPPVGDADLHSPLTGLQVTDTTPVLALRSSIVDEEVNLNRAGFRVIVRNLSTGRAVATVTKDVPPSRTNKGKSRGIDYQVTVVDVETGRAAMIGDRLEISVRSPNPLMGVQPLQYTVTAEDVKQSLIQLPALVTYEIPAETQLLANYPNPFNPETWIPYRLAEDAFVTLTIYDLSGQVVRALEVGHQIAAVYEDRSKAVYWDGRNQVGEQVASGVYFYHLSAGDYSTTRKMVILK